MVNGATQHVRDARLQFTVLLPDTPNQPIDVHDHSVGLHMAVVDKSCVHLLNTEWESPGAYILLDRAEGDGS